MAVDKSSYRRFYCLQVMKDHFGEYGYVHEIYNNADLRWTCVMGYRKEDTIGRCWYGATWEEALKMFQDYPPTAYDFRKTGLIPFESEWETILK